MSDYSVPSAMMFQAAAAAATTLADSKRQYKWQKETEARQEQYNIKAEQRAQGYNKENMALSYQYGEQAADAADARTRALYEDLYGIGAQLEQLKENGLSPGLMYGKGGIGGSSTPSGAQGTGAHSGNVPAYPTEARNPLANVQLSLGWSQVAKNLAEAEAMNKTQKREDEKQPGVLENIDTTNKKILQEISNLLSQKMETEAKTLLANAQADLTDLQAGMAEATFANNVAYNGALLQTAWYQMEEAKNQLEITDKTKAAQIDKVFEELNNMKKQGVILILQQNAARQGLEIGEKQLEVMAEDILKKQAETNNIEETTKYFEKDYKLRERGIVVQEKNADTKEKELDIKEREFMKGSLGDVKQWIAPKRKFQYGGKK